jgi:hypothetical protein
MTPTEITEIGDLSLEITAEGRLLRLTIAEQQPTTTLSREGATALMTYLYNWLWLLTDDTRDTAAAFGEDER